MSHILCLGGQPGAGKDAVARMLCERIPTLARVPRITTRQPRPQEQPGYDYRFISRDEFAQLVSEQQVIGYDDFCGAFYGIHIADIQKAWLTQKLACGVFGISSIAVKAYFPSALTVYLEAPLHILEQRMYERGDDPAVIQRRLIVIEQKLAVEPQQFCVRINNHGALDDCVEEIIRLLKANVMLPSNFN